MIEQKENDWIVNILGNLHLSTADLKEAGLNAENTSLLDEEVYKRSSLITENPLFKNDNGDFDDTKFHDFYEQASFMYNMLANDTYLDKMAEQQTIYGKDDIFAPKELRRTFEDTVKYTRVHNADRTTTGLIRIGETTAPKLSRDEIAQSQKVLANPVEAEKDPSKAIWHDSPNDSWFTDFFDTRVLAAWDLDGEHQDLITGETVLHKKGDLKLNENGTYYYENLDGRDIYGKLVLNKMNTLTTDGSTLNKYDFFDSDDLELKSIAGSIIKNAALVGSMFIPYVGPWVAGLSVASQLVGLSGTLGKMLLGSDSPTLSALEGWAKSVNRQTAKSQYAQENTWCWENFINLIGDVMGQLKELRFLFEYAPAIIKGTKVAGWNGISQTKQAKFAEELALKYKALNEAKWDKLRAAREAAGKGITASEVKSYSALRSAEQLMGNKDVEKFMKSYLHIGEILSKGYMTAITVGDTYGEAKNEGGASDIEATLLTLGYAAAEYKILSTGIGEWILPELKNSGLKHRAIIKALANVPEAMRISAKNKAVNASKKELAKYWFNKGKELATNITLVGKGLGGQVISAGLGEGVEEVSEELLSDVSKSCYNVVQWLQGDNNRMSAWDNVYDRYMMSFVGGAVGGGLTAAGTEFKMNNEQMSPEKAVLELVYMIRENKEKELYKALDKMIIANPYLLNELEISADKKSMVFKPATSESSNMDLDVKKAFKHNVEVLKSLINSEGLRISDLAFLDKQTFNDIKLAKLQESPVASLYLLDFNTLCTEIVGIRDEINKAMSQKSDNGELSADALELINKKNEELLLKRLRKDQYLNGDLAMDYVGKAAFSLTPIFSEFYHYSFFKDYVKHKYNKELSELSESDLKQYREEFENWKNTDHKNDVSVLAPMYLEMARKSGMFILEFAKNYDNVRKNTTLLNLINSRLALQEVINALGIESGTTKVREDVDLNEWINTLLKIYTQESADTALSLIYSYGNEEVKNRVKLFIDSVKKLDENSPTYKQDFLLISNLLTNLVSLDLALNVDTYFDEFIATGAINPEIKHSLQLVLNNTKAWLGKLKMSVLYSPNSKELLALIPDYGFDENTTLLELKDSLDPLSKEELADDFDTLVDDVTVIYNLLGLTPKLPEQITLKDFDLVKLLLNDLSSKVDLKISTLNNVTYTDTINFIQNYIQTNSDSKLDMSKLLETVNGILDLNLTNLEGAVLDGSIDQINEGIEVIGWLLGLVLGAQVDSDANLDNLVGYNVTMNEIAKNNHVKDYIPLPTITKDDALIINLDLELVKNKLLLAKAIYSINQGKKLLLLDTVAVNKNYINYNRLKKFIVNIGDEWKEKDKLADALEGAEVLKKYADSRDLKSLTDRDKEELEKERANIENAIFDFFNSEENLKKIQNGELHTLFKKGFDLYSSTSLLINAETELLDDRNFLWYLASRAAIKHSGFYNIFKLVVNDKVAPIPTLEESIFLNVAFILNGDMFNLFKDAYIKATLDEFNNSSETEKRRILLDRFNIADLSVQTEIINNNDLINEPLFPIYSNIYLTLGIPGAGKTKAVNYYTVLIINKVDLNLLKKAWVAHNTKSKAEELAKSFDTKVDSIFDKNSLMSAIYSNYNTSRARDREGNYLYDKDDWVRDPKTNRIVYKYKSDDIAKENIPSFIVIEEVSHYDLADLMLLDDFAKKYGIPIITFGDFDQSSSTARSINWAGKDQRGYDLDLLITPEESHFMFSPKLGISMRTANTQMDKTTTSFRAGNKVKKAYYYLDNTIGINGVKLIASSKITLIEKDIQAMIATLKPKEKIGLIYYDPESEVVKLVNEKFRDKFELFLGTSALGGEGQYYVVDASGSNKGTVGLLKDLYTAITRASLGVLLTGLSDDSGINIENILENVTMDSSYSKAGVLNYSKRRKNLFDTVYTSDDKLTYVPRKIVTTVTIPAPPKIQPITPTLVPTGTIPPAVATPTTSSVAAPSGYSPTNLVNNANITNADALNRVLVEKDGHNIFLMDSAARTFVLANINGVIIPFYMSSHGTDGKIKGNWYPFFGMTGTWLVKGGINKDGSMTYGSAIDTVTKLLNDNLHLDSTKNIHELGVDGLKPYSFSDRFPPVKDPNGEVFYVANGFETMDGSRNGKKYDALYVEELTGIDASKVVNEYTAPEGFITGIDFINQILSRISGNAVLADTSTSTPTKIFEDDSNVRVINNEGIEYYTDGIKVAKKVNDTLEELDPNDPIAKKILGIYNNLNAESPENTLLDETSEKTLKNVETLNNGQSKHPLLEESAIEETSNGKFDFTYLLHSHNTFELGIRDNNDKIEFFDSDLSRYLYRIDNVIGLMKVFEKDWKKPTNPTSFYTDMIRDLRGYLFNVSDKSDLMLALSSVFNPDEDNSDLDVASLEFGLISSPNVSKRNLELGLKWGYGLDAKEFGVFDKNYDERTIGNANPDPESQTVNRKSINAIITLNNGKRISLPLFVLGNLETYTRNPQNDVSKKLAALYEQVNHDSYKFHKAILEDPDLKNIPEIYNLARLYLFTNAGYFEIDDHTWTPAKNLKNWGIQINTSSISGEKFPYLGTPTPIRNSITDSGFIFSKQIYTSQLLLVDNSNNVYDFANIGHAFVLVSQDPRINTDKKMLELYEKLLLDPSTEKKVTLVYIAPPKVPIRDYLLNLYELINEKDPNKRINIKKLGSHLTSYYIWLSILPELKSGIFSDKVDEKTKNHLISVIESLNSISDGRLLLNEVMANQVWEGVNTGVVEQSVYKHLNYALLSLFVDVDGNIILENLNNLILTIEKTGLNGIYYSTKFKNKVPPKDLIMVPLESDLDSIGNSLYSINGLPFTINAKLDSNLFSSKDLSPIIESFVNKIVAPTSKNPRETSKDTWNFIHPNRKSTTNSSNVKTIPLEENSLGLSELKILIQDDIVTINGISRKLEGEEKNMNKESFIPYTKEELKSVLQLRFGPLYNEKYVDYFYNKQIELLSKNEPFGWAIGDKIEEYLSNLMLDYNQWNSESKVFLNSWGDVVLVTFNNLAKFGINEFVIRDALDNLVFNNEGIAEYLYDKDTIIRFNERTKSAEIVRLGQELSTTNDKYNDLMSLDPSSPIIQIFTNVGWLEDFTKLKDAYDWSQLSDLKGTEAVDELTDILKSLDKDNPSYLELKDLLNYLAEDAEYCTRILKSI